jgi:hypothetical protein
MERDDMLALLKGLAEGLLAGEMKPALWARTVEGLISSNLDTVPDLEDAALRLADFGMRGAVNPPAESDLSAIARRLIDLAAAEGA